MRDEIGTWNRLIEVVRARWPVTSETPESLVIGSGARSLRVDRLEVAAFADSAFVALRFVLCGVDQLSPTSALRINAALALGKLCLRDRVYELEHSVDLKAMSADQLERRLGFLAKLIDSLRTAHTAGAASDPDAYAMFAD